MAFNSLPEWAKIPSHDSDSDSDYQNNKEASFTTFKSRKFHISKSTKFLLASTITISTSIIILLFLNPRILPSHTQYPNIHSTTLQAHYLKATESWNYTKPSPCGSTPAQAREAGCLWSAMTFAWYPSSCYDHALNEKFLAAGDWHWYSSNLTLPQNELAREDILSGDIKVAFMSMEYHKLHCMYMVRKLWGAVLGEALSDNYILTRSHLEHCEKMMLREGNPPVKGITKYFDCVEI